MPAPEMQEANSGAQVVVTLLLFARVREAFGRGRVSINVPPTVDADILRTAIARDHPSLEPLLGDCVFAINEEYLADGPITVSIGDEVAVIPPISGG